MRKTGLGRGSPRAGRCHCGGRSVTVRFRELRGDAVPLPAAEPAPSAERNRFAQQLFTPLPARYDRLAEVLSFGQNGRWRRAMISRAAPAEEGTGLDGASGTAGVALQIAARTGARGGG